jgi:hypothetical protein
MKKGLDRAIADLNFFSSAALESRRYFWHLSSERWVRQVLQQYQLDGPSPQFQDRRRPSKWTT